MLNYVQVQTLRIQSFTKLRKVTKKIGKVGKRIEVEDTSSNEKGWIAGWHTNLDIVADNTKEKNPLQGKTIVLDPGHGGSDQGASSNTKYKSLEKIIR